MCLESLYVQSPAIDTYFSVLSELSEGVSWTLTSLPFLFGYSNRTEPFDIPFDKIRENILDLEFDLADMMMLLEIRVRELNRFLMEDTEYFSFQSKTDHAEMLKALENDKRVNMAIAEYIRLIATASRNARKQLFEGRKKIVIDWSSVDAKHQEVDKRFMEAAGIRNP